MHDMATSEEYKHLPISRLALFAQRLGCRTRRSRAKHRTRCMAGRGMTWSRSWPRPGRRHCRSGWPGTGLLTAPAVRRQRSLQDREGMFGERRWEEHARARGAGVSRVGPESRSQESAAPRRAGPLASARHPDVRTPWCRMCSFVAGQGVGLLGNHCQLPRNIEAGRLRASHDVPASPSRRAHQRAHLEGHPW